MNRQDFISTLFDNGDGLSLDQIQHIEDFIAENMPEVMIEGIADSFEDKDDPEIIETALYLCRENFMNNLKDCGDMLALRDLLFENYKLNVTDMQVYRLWYIRED